MMTLAWALIATPIVVGLYAYAIYPLLLRMLPAHRTAPVEDPVEWPLVTIVVPAYNEAAQIRGAIEALLAQRYPADRRQILILSDASTDATDSIVAEYAAQGVELMRMATRGGKTAAENASCAVIRGTIVVNTDASIRLHPETVRELVRHISQAGVGVASSRDVSISARDTSANTAEAGYVDYEMRVRALETRTGGIVGASGSGYAIRADLHRIPVRDDLSRDFSAALTVRRHGYDAVSVDSAICYVPRTAALRREYKRKVRTISRGMETLYYNRDLLDVHHHGTFAWKLLSHKVCRWLVPHAGLLGVVGVALLAPTSAVAIAVLACVAASVIVTLVVATAPEDRPFPRPVSLLAFAIAANAAVLQATWRIVVGHEDHIWEPTRRAPASETA